MSKFSIQSVAASFALAPMRLNDALHSAASLFARARKLEARQIAALALATLVLTAVADPALAQAGGQGNITSFLQNIVNLLTGTAGKLIAVLAICVVGISALLGAMSVRAFGGTILGVMLLFSAAWIVDQIVGI